MQTVFNWLHRLGFKYEPRRKNYYVDAHEKPKVKLYRAKFTKHYLELEKRMFCWVQLKESEAEELEIINTVKGYSYLSDDGVQMIEYHVDDHDLLADRLHNWEETSACTFHKG
jgi:hypothetical protein